MIVTSRTPLRVSFAGGGSDLPAFYRDECGAVVSTAICAYVHITINSTSDSRICARHSATEIVNSADEIQHDLIREALHKVRLTGGIEVTSNSDVPALGTGLGSSSSYTVGLLHALYRYGNQHVGAERLAREACHIEIERCGKPIGKQDQYIAAYGGLKYLQFNPDDSVDVDPIVCAPATREALESHLLLLYTGITRTADPILAEQQRDLFAGGPKRQLLKRMVRLAGELRDALVRNDPTSLGDILHEGWMVKKRMAERVSNPQIDQWYECARAHGAVGGKITGAGGGGFLLLYASREAHRDICSALPSLQRVMFQMDGQGSRIIRVEEHDRD